jgi:hypothetical protein
MMREAGFNFMPGSRRSISYGFMVGYYSAMILHMLYVYCCLDCLSKAEGSKRFDRRVSNSHIVDVLVFSLRFCIFSRISNFVRY